MQKKASLNDIVAIIHNFNEKRGWESNDPNQLISSILIELAELAEHFQWKDHYPELSKEERVSLGYEFVDVIFYLFRLADKAGVDIETSFFSKLPLLEKKFSVGQTDDEHFKIKKDYRQTGKNRLYR